MRAGVQHEAAYKYGSSPGAHHQHQHHTVTALTLPQGSQAPAGEEFSGGVGQVHLLSAASQFLLRVFILSRNATRRLSASGSTKACVSTLSLLEASAQGTRCWVEPLADAIKVKELTVVGICVSMRGWSSSCQQHYSTQPTPASGLHCATVQQMPRRSRDRYKS